MGIPVVYDCMLFLQAASRPDRVHRTFEFVANGTVDLFISRAVLAEIRDVLNRVELRKKFPALTAGHVDSFLNHILATSNLVDDVPEVFQLPRDPKDEPYVNLAIASNARYLVTWNERHLTYLMRGDTSEGIGFCRRYPELQILTPTQLLNELNSGSDQ